MPYFEPWEAFPSIWKSKSAYFTWLRGSLRRVWSKYPAKLTWKNSQMQGPPEGYTGRGKKFGRCHYCGELFVASKLEVDHVEQAGTCNSWDTAYSFLHNLLECSGNWVLACKPCHKAKSYSESQGVDMETATATKKAIETEKLGKEFVIDLCTKMGYNASSLTNAKLRRSALVAIFLEEGKKANE